MNRFRITVLVLLAAASTAALAQPIDPNLYSGLQWRLIGPFRGGKATMVSGSPGNPALYYMGTAGSGVWKTVDGGQVWTCVSDSVRLTGIGAVAVAPSRPDTVYVGATTARRGPVSLHRRRGALGIWWRCKGTAWLPSRSIRTIPDLVMAAAGRYRRDAQRPTAEDLDIRVCPTRRWAAVWLVFDPDNAKNVYAGTRARRGGAGAGADAALRRSPRRRPIRRFTVPRRGRDVDKDQPRRICPAAISGPIALAVAPGTKGKRVYDYVAQGMFRSDDGGAALDARHRRSAAHRRRAVSRRDRRSAQCQYRVRDADVALSLDRRGQDVGVLRRRAQRRGLQLRVDRPDQRQVHDPRRGSGRGISMDAGRTWTTWFNQPTGQMYNVTTDHGFPFFLYSAQQDSGTVATPIAGRDGQITYRDWYTTNGFESAQHYSRSGGSELSLRHRLVWFDSASQ